MPLNDMLEPLGPCPAAPESVSFVRGQSGRLWLVWRIYGVPHGSCGIEHMAEYGT